MRLLVDECTGPVVARWLADQGHDVVSIADDFRGIDDATVLAMAAAEDRILVTADKGFGERIHRGREPHCGIVLLRLDDQRPASQIHALRDLLTHYADRLPGSFAVVDEKLVRFARRD